MTELAPNHRWQLAGAYLLAFASTGFGTLLLAPWRETIELSNIALLYVLAVVLIAISSGRGPAVAAALLSALDFAYVFVPPHYSLAITEAQYILVAAIMLVVALAVGHLTSRLKQSVDRAERKSAVSAALCGLAQELAGAVSAASIRQCTEKFLTASLGVRRTNELAYHDYIEQDLKEHEYLGEEIRNKLIYYPTVTREPFRNTGRQTDLITSDKIFADLGEPPLDPATDRGMICGSPAMLKEISLMLDSYGFQISPHIGEAGDYVIERAFVEQ